MTQMINMRISYSLGSLLSINDVLNCTKILSKKKVDVIWIPETWGMENFGMLSAISQIHPTANIGSSIINIYSRSPSLIAMGAATLDTICNKRLILGLGTSSQPIVENFHGYPFENPLKRMREYVNIIKLALSGNKVNYNGHFYNLKDFGLLIKPPRNNIPIFLAAINKKMVELTWEIADGVIFYLRPIDELKNTVSKMQSKRKIDVACQVITCVSEDSQKAVERAKKTLAFYVSVGEIYRRFLAQNGFEQETENIFSEYKKTGLESCHEHVTDKMLSSLVVCGAPDECKKQMKRFVDAGLTLPIIQFNPIDDVQESFELLTRTFSNE